MTLLNLATILDAKLTDDILEVGNVRATSREVIEHLLPYPNMDFNEYEVIDESNGLIVRGTGTFMGAEGSRMELSLQARNTALYSELIAEFPEQFELNVPGLDVRVGKMSARYSRNGTTSQMIAGEIRIGEFALPLSLVPTGKSNLYLKTGTSEIELSGIGDALTLIGADDAANNMPLEVAGAVKLTDLEALFDYEKGYLYDVGFAVGVQGNWQIIPDVFTFQEMGVQVHIRNPVVAHLRQVGLRIHAQMMMGETLVPVTLEGPDSAGNWMLYTKPVTPNTTLAETLKMVGAEEAANDLPEALQNMSSIALDALQVSLNPRTQTLNHVSFSLKTTAPWEIVPGTIILEEVAFQLDIANIMDATNRSFDVKLGAKSTLFNSQVNISGEYADQALTINGSISYLNLTGIVDELLTDVTVPDTFPDIAFQEINVSVNLSSGDFSFSGQTAEAWRIPLEFAILEIDDILFELTQEKMTQAEIDALNNPLPTLQAQNPPPQSSGNEIIYRTGKVGGTLRLGAMVFKSSVAFMPGKTIISGSLENISLSQIIQAVTGPEAVQGLALPPDVAGLTLHKLSLMIVPETMQVAFLADSDLGTLEFVARHASGGWNFVIGIAPPDTFKFSMISPALEVMDGINFAGSGLVIAMSEDTSLQLTSVRVPAGFVIKQGLNFFARMDLRGSGVDELLKINELQVSAVIGKPEDLEIAGAIVGDFPIAEGVTMANIMLKFRPDPTNFSFTLSGKVLAMINDSPLEFYGDMQVQPTGADFSATMLGKWEEPFDAQGVAVQDLAIELGVGFATGVPLPTIGLAGRFYIEEFEGAVAVKFDAANVSRSMLAIEFNSLYLVDVMDALVTPDVMAGISQEVKDEFLNVGFSDVDIYIVPIATTIGMIAYEQGLRIKGSMEAWGLKMHLNALVDYTQGIHFRGEVEPLNIEDVLIISGAEGTDTSALMELDLRIGKKAFLKVTGMVTILGMSRSTYLSIDENGFEFEMTGSLFDKFNATLFVKGGNLDNATGIYVRASMENDLFKHLREEAAKHIQAVAADVNAELEVAQADIRAAQTEVNRLNDEIGRLKQQAHDDRVAYLNGLIRHGVKVRDDAQREYDKFNRMYNDHHRALSAQRERDTRALRNAQADVRKARNALNSHKQSIRDKKSARDKAERNRRYWDKKGWDTPIWDGARKQHFDKARDYAKKRDKLNWEITGLEIEVGVKEAALWTAEQALQGVISVQTAPPIEADPTLISYASVREANKASLNIAKTDIRNWEAAKRDAWTWANNNVAANALIATRDIAVESLNVAYDALAVTQDAVALSADIAEAVSRAALGGIVDVEFASFEGLLDSVNGGAVHLQVGVSFLEGPVETLELGFNFADPAAGGKNLGRMLIAKHNG